MIRNLQTTDMDRVAEIWLQTNLRAHGFLSAAYWEGYFEPVKQMLPQAEVYLYEEAGEILGFIGLNGEEIEGLFVWGSAQGRGIGKRLMDHAKRIKGRLYLSVYQKNAGAIRFYRREGFRVVREGIEMQTGEKEYRMTWEKGAASSPPEKEEESKGGF